MVEAIIETHNELRYVSHELSYVNHVFPSPDLLGPDRYLYYFDVIVGLLTSNHHGDQVHAC